MTLLVAAALSAGTMAQIPYLVKDINARPAAAWFSGLAAVGDTLFFAVGRDGKTELWKSDGSASGTSLVQTLCTTDCYPPKELFASGGFVFFRLQDRLTGHELWRSDGTAAGTVLVKDIEPGTGDSWPESFMDVAGTLFFTARNGASGEELWKSDGTEAGTVLVKDIEPGPDSSSPRPLLAVGDTLFFANTAGDARLWKTQGTEATTVALDLPPGTLAPSAMAELSGVLYFAAEELWRTDGTQEGTWRVKDINPGPDWSQPARLAAVGGVLLFTAYEPASGRELWRSDGTEAGTIQVKDICPGWRDSSYIPDRYSVYEGNALAVLDETYLFVASDGLGGFELWRSDGTEAGTTLVADIRPGWDGSEPDDFAIVAGQLLFSADDGATGRELWRSDGTGARTALVKETCPGTCSAFWRGRHDFTALDDVLMLVPRDGMAAGELWRSDGTEAGTSRVMRFEAEFATPGSWPSDFTELGAMVLFAADDGVGGRELWKSDGSEAGTLLVRDIEPGPASSTPSSLVVAEARIFFEATTAATGRELWRSDGTEAGTELVKDICPGPCDGLHEWQSQIVPVGDRVYVVADDGVSGLELWLSDGTEAGTIQVKDVAPGAASASLRRLVPAEGTLFFRATDESSGEELWRSDGTEAGTFMVVDLCSGSCTPFHYAGDVDSFALGSTLYFRAGHGLEAGLELWKSDGTAEGTVLVKDIVPGSGHSEPHDPGELGGDLLFFATTGLWRSDGTEAGTVFLRDVSLSDYGGGPLVVAGGDVLLFRDYPHQDLWRTDGTEAGTVSIKSFESGISYMIDFDGTAMFVAAAGEDYELWRSDGSEAGTVPVASFSHAYPGEVSPAPAAGRLYFSGESETLGPELWAISPAPGPETLRNDYIRALDPMTPALASIFPLEPLRDAIGSLPPGALDPDEGIVTDRGRPLVFYGVAASKTIQLVKTDTLRIRIEY